jgi:hypothetical protein
MYREHFLPYCRLELHDNYTIVTTSEGVNIDFDEIEEINAILQRSYNGRLFGMIANRKNRYSINPLAAKKLFSDESVVAGAVVGYNLATRLNAEIENEIIDGAPIVFFTDLNSAIRWIEAKVEQDSRKLTTASV